jgi:hypothetical protein
LRNGKKRPASQFYKTTFSETFQEASFRKIGSVWADKADKQGCQIFLGTKYQNGDKYIK